MYCLKYAMPGLRSDPSLLTVWSFYRACLSNIYLVAAKFYLPDSHVIFDLLADQLISSSGIIFQGNSTKHCPSWDLLCQDFKGKFLSVTRRLVLARLGASSINQLSHNNGYLLHYLSNYLFLYLVSKASSGSHTKLTYLPLEMFCLKYIL